MNKENIIIITLKNAEGDLVSCINETLKVSVKNKRLLVAVKEVAIGKYEASFTPNRCGEYIISIQIDGNDISGSPYRYVHMYVHTVCMLNKMASLWYRLYIRT